MLEFGRKRRHRRAKEDHMKRLGILVAAVAMAVAACANDSGRAAADAGAAGGAAALDPSDAAFDPAHLVAIEIDMAAADWDALRFEHHDFLKALGDGCQASPPTTPYGVYQAELTIDGEHVGTVGVRKKGFLGSVTPVRPSLKVHLDFVDQALRHAGLSQLTLNNNHQDTSQINACLAYELFRAAGSPAPRCNFARVSVNGEHLGIYSHVEDIGKPMLRRWFDDDAGNLYEGVLSDFRPGWTDTFELKTNEAEADRSDLARVVTALEASDEEVVAALDAVVDLDAFYTFWAIESLVNHWDGYNGNLNNFHVYHDPTSDKMRFIPWGVDAAFGIANPFPPLNRPPSVHAVSSIARRLYGVPSAQALYRARLGELLNQVWDENALSTEVDRMEGLIGQHVHLPASAFEAGLGRVRRFVAERRAQIEVDLSGDAPAWVHPLRGNPCLTPVGAITGTFATSWEEPFPAGNPLGVGTGNMTVTLDGTTPPLSLLGFTAGRSNVIGGDRQGVMAFGLRGDTGDGVFLFLGIEPELYAIGTIPVDMYSVFSIVNQGPLGPSMPLRGFAVGTLELDQAGTAPGEPVSGSFDVQVWGQGAQ
jgi:hypothetical protein